MAPSNKYRTGFVVLIIPVFFFVIANLAFAETKVFLEEYTYQASEADSKISSRVIALEQVKRLLLERLGTYLESETEVKNFQLTKDQIVTLTAGIVRAEITEEKWDGKTYSLKAKITADPKDVASSIDKLRQDRQKTKELEETRKKADEALREVERLRKQLEIKKAGQAEQDQYKNAVNRLSAKEWVKTGMFLTMDAIVLGIPSKNQEALEALSKGIELDPTDPEAYTNRGRAYSGLGNYQQAIKEYDTAIELDPKDAFTYFLRGLAYSDLGDHRRAIKDFDRAMELDPKLARAYTNRGIAYGVLGDHRRAIRNFDRAIELDPTEINGEAYYNRGIAYANLGDYWQAIRDYKIAARLGSKKAQNFLRSQGISW